MARWRAVPTAVSTAVGALAFLASAGLAVVLGAGLHVWSGPATPGALGSRPPSSSLSVTGRVGGVVTVQPPATPRLPQTAPGGPGPSITLPFVPFASSPAAPPSSTSTGSPAHRGPGPVATPAHTGGSPSALRTLLAALRSLPSSSHVAVDLQRSGEVRFALRADAEHASHGHHGHGRALGHRHHGHEFARHPRGHAYAYAWGHHRHGHGHGHGHRHGHGEHGHHGHRHD